MLCFPTNKPRVWPPLEPQRCHCPCCSPRAWGAADPSIQSRADGEVLSRFRVDEDAGAVHGVRD